MKRRYEKNKQRYWENVDERRRRMREDKRLRYRAGICTQCLRTRSPGFSTCDLHREVRRLESYVRYLRAEGRDTTEALLQYEAAKTATRLPLKPTKRTRPVDDIVVKDDDDHGLMRPRILRSLRFFDWVTAGELFDAMGIEMDHAANQYNNAAVQLSRLCREGLVEKRGVRGAYDWRITAAGREALAPQLKRAA